MQLHRGGIQGIGGTLQAVKTIDEQTGKARYPVKAINILKAHGKSALDSQLINGYAISMSRAAQVWLAGLCAVHGTMTCLLTVPVRPSCRACPPRCRAPA